MAVPKSEPVAKAALDPGRQAALSALLAQCPDGVLIAISGAAESWPGSGPVVLIQAIAEEQALRLQIATVYAPVLPLFRPRADGLDALVFPAGLLRRLAVLARERERELLELVDGTDDVSADVVADRLCGAAAAILREDPLRVWPDTAWPEAQAARANLPKLAECLELSSLLRPAVQALPHWLSRASADHQASLNLLMRDAAAASPDGMARLLDVLIAHVADATQLPQLLCNVLGPHANEDLIRQSDAGHYVDDLFAEADRSVTRVCQAKPGPDVDMEALIGDLTFATQMLSQMDMTLPMDADGVWKTAIRKARSRLGDWATKQFSAAESCVADALPLERVQLSGKMTRQAPQLSADPDSPAARQALAVCALVGISPSCSNALGAEGQRKQSETGIMNRVATWTDEALEMANRGDVEDPVRALELIELAASLLDRILATDAARTLRRRASAFERTLADREDPLADLGRRVA